MKAAFRLLLSFLFICASPVHLSAAEANPHQLPDGLYSEITTERGVIVAELFYRQTPMTVANHVGLAEGTLGPEPREPFYEGSRWHRVVADFVVQGGGGGRIGYQFPDEFVPGLRHDGLGTMQMANSGPDSNGSQFCFMLSPQHRLNYLHTVFGKVVRGLDVLPKIQQGDTMRVKILRIGDEAKAFRADEETFKKLVASAKRYTGSREPGPDGHFDDPDQLLPTEWSRARGFNFKLANFERFTGTKIAARLFAETPEAAAGDKMDAYLRSEAERLGVARTGALLIYVADARRWHLRLGADSMDAFLGQSGAGADTAAVEKITRDFFAEAEKEAEKTIATARQNAPADRPLAAGQELKLRLDAVLDHLIFRLEPKR